MLDEFQARLAAAMGSDEGAEAPVKEEVVEEMVEEEQPPEEESAIFTIPEALINEGGGAPEDPHEIKPENMGRFSYREFETKKICSIT